MERREGETQLRMTFVGEEKTRQEVKSSIVGSEARKNKRHRTGNRADMGRGVLRPYEEEPKTHPHKTRMGHPEEVSHLRRSFRGRVMRPALTGWARL